jgi:FkbM family methyltransferase
MNRQTWAGRLSALTGMDRHPKAKLAIKSVLYFLRDPLNRGVALSVGGRSTRVPARFARQPWTNFETTSTTVVSGWLDRHPDACLLDIGSSVGVYSLLALHQGARTRVYAFDASLIALKATQWFCKFEGAERLRAVYGFVSDQHVAGDDADGAVRATGLLLDLPSTPREPSLTGYVCISEVARPDVPMRSIDGLFPSPDAGRPWLLKCDVEGAEMLVLKGAENFIRRVGPQLIVSVHPNTLRGFGFTTGDVRLWLEERGYRIQILAVDHEEHWWCTPSAP